MEVVYLVSRSLIKEFFAKELRLLKDTDSRNPVQNKSQLSERRKIVEINCSFPCINNFQEAFMNHSYGSIMFLWSDNKLPFFIHLKNLSWIWIKAKMFVDVSRVLLATRVLRLKKNL